MVGLYEICFEQSWKAMKELLENFGYADGATGSPRTILKTAYKAGMISDEELWLDALVSRNNVAHAYNQACLLYTSRLINDRIAQLRRELKEVQKHRDITRAKREKNKVPVVAIVGYTNAGKSTLLNHLTEADVLEEDKLFATLDPTTRILALDGKQQVLLTDTVGFIRKMCIRDSDCILQELCSVMDYT